MKPATVVSREEWLAARTELLHEEKEFTHRREALAAKRRQLPWVEIEKNYQFDSTVGKVSLGDLFDGRHQLLVYHFMFAPEWSQGCKSCSLLADHYDPAIIHLNHRDTTMISASRAPLAKIQAFRERMGWKFNWVSTIGDEFGRDFGVLFREQELSSGLNIYNYEREPYPISDLPGLSVFYRDDDGRIFHTYSTYARGLDTFINAYNFLDVTPKGRDEENIEIMSWVRHHDRYDGPGYPDPWMETAVAEKTGA
jgi:predicted dithiol-disulfide oxidoreductase (DUF899 family)